MNIKVIENVMKLNDEVASLNREAFHAAGVVAIEVIGGPGAGKTALLEATIRAVHGRLSVGVVVGDLATTRDAQRLSDAGAAAVQVNTGKGCHLDANQVRQALRELDLQHLDMLFIENVGNLICPVGFDLGQDLKVGLFSVCEGDDKAAKHPHLVHAADLLLLNKTDLLEHVAFDRQVFMNDVESLNPLVRVIELSVRKGDMHGWLDWLTMQTRQTRALRACQRGG